MQAVIVRRIFEIKLEHEAYSLTQIANRINLEGYTTSKGSLFTKVQIKRILDCKDFYSGIYKYGQIEAKGEHRAII